MLGSFPGAPSRPGPPAPGVKQGELTWGDGVFTCCHFPVFRIPSWRSLPIAASRSPDRRGSEAAHLWAALSCWYLVLVTRLRVWPPARGTEKCNP